MNWHLSHRFDPRALAIADRHYPPRTEGRRQFVRPSSNVVLVTADADALWVTVRQKHAKHAWPGAWECAAFRNEAPARYLSSDLIREALAATRWMWGDPPAAGVLTFVDAAQVRHKRDPGRCFRRVGFALAGASRKRKRLALLLSAALCPASDAPIGAAFALDLPGPPASPDLKGNP